MRINDEVCEQLVRHVRAQEKLELNVEDVRQALSRVLTLLELFGRWAKAEKR